MLFPLRGLRGWVRLLLKIGVHLDAPGTLATPLTPESHVCLDPSSYTGQSPQSTIFPRETRSFLIVTPRSSCALCGVLWQDLYCHGNTIRDTILVHSRKTYVQPDFTCVHIDIHGIPFGRLGLTVALP